MTEKNLIQKIKCPKARVFVWCNLTPEDGQYIEAKKCAILAAIKDWTGAPWKAYLGQNDMDIYFN